jgi:hypothetical protein
VDAAAAQHRLITAERVLLEQTLHGSIKALTDVLALTNPASFGRASRIKQRVSELAGILKTEGRWQVEVAAMLSQLGCITLPAATIEKVYYGRPLAADEEQMVAQVPAITEQLLGSIPRLEVVRGIIAAAAKPFGHRSCSDPLVGRCSQLLRAAVDFDVLEAQGRTHEFALATLRGQSDRYDADVVGALDALYGTGRAQQEIREIPLSNLEIGMVFAEDVKLATGALLAARGYEVTAGFVERARNFQHGVAKNAVRVIMPAIGMEAELV